MSLTLLLDMAASGHANRTAFGNRTAATSFKALARNAAAGAAIISKSNSQHVVFVGRNGPALPLLLFAAATAGVPFAPLNYRLGHEQLLELLGELDRPFVVADEDYLPFILPEYRAVSTPMFLADAARADPTDAVPVSDEAPAVLLFTSGTTARPKAVILRHENLVAYIVSTVEFGGAGENEAALVAVPPYHIAAISSALSNLYAGRRVVYLPDFDAKAWLQLVHDERITTAMVVPTMLARIVDVLDGSQPETPALKLISYGGARMPRPVLERALRAFPSVGFCNAYGLTETSSTIALLGPDDHRSALSSDDETVRQRLGSVGRSVPGIELQIRDELGTILAAGMTGELWVRGAQVSGQYRGQRSALDNSGWFYTRDRARIDASGYLYIEGRSDDTIIRGGENIAPAEIEQVLLQHPAVKDVAVLGQTDDEWGEKIVAVVVREPNAEVEADALRTYVREQLRGSRTPDEVVWRTELPYTETGKLVRRDLLRQIVER